MANLSRASIKPEQVITFLKKDIQYRQICQRIVEQRVIEQAAQARGLTITSEEIQAEANRIRLEKRLEKAADTLAWLAEQMITAEDWEVGICDRLLEQKLARLLFAKEVEKFFAENKADFEQILLYQIIVPNERIAQELFYQIEEEEINFYEAAHLYDLNEQRRQQCGFEGKLDRWSLLPDIAAVVFSAQPGEIIGPLQTEQGHHLMMIQKFIPAELTAERYQNILNDMFKQWLASELNYLLHAS